MPRQLPTEAEKAQMNLDIQRAKETVKDALRPFEDKLRHAIIGAAVTDLNIEIR